MNNSIPLCTECKFYRYSRWTDITHQCLNPTIVENFKKECVSVEEKFITGKSEEIVMFATHERNPDFKDHLCGSEGKLFQRRGT